jgi:hypothetical protein
MSTLTEVVVWLNNSAQKSVYSVLRDREDHSVDGHGVVSWHLVSNTIPDHVIYFVYKLGDSVVRMIDTIDSQELKENKYYKYVDIDSVEKIQLYLERHGFVV